MVLAPAAGAVAAPDDDGLPSDGGVDDPAPQAVKNKMHTRPIAISFTALAFILILLLFKPYS